MLKVAIMEVSPFVSLMRQSFFILPHNHILMWSKWATLYGRLVLAASGSGMQTVTPVQCSPFSLISKENDHERVTREVGGG